MSSVNDDNANRISIETMDFSTNIDSDEKQRCSSRVIQTIIDLIVIVIIFAIFGFVYSLVDPKIRYMTCDQSDIFFPYKPDTVPFWAVGIFATIGPLIFIVGVEFINSKLLPCQASRRGHRLRRFMICTFHAISLFVLGISITLLLTDIGKRWVGRLRPHFMSVCKPDYSKINCTSNGLTGVLYNPIYTGDGFCTGSAKDVEEARFSFPSGHSSYSWYTMVFLIVYLEARLFLLRFRFIKPLIQMTAFIAAFVTCLSRISDYHHRGSDVIGGTVLGVVIALGITFVVGRVLWEYEVKKPYGDFDLLPKKTTRKF